MSRRFIMIVSSALITLTALPALAATALRPGYEEAYGMAGCGLGSILANELKWENGGLQILAATTNGTMYSQMFGITTGISNCDDGLLTKELKAEQEVFIGANLAQLSKDTARGDGEYVAAFAELLGCAESSASAAQFLAEGKANHAMIFATAAPTEVLTRYKAMIAERKLSCARA